MMNHFRRFREIVANTMTRKTLRSITRNLCPNFNLACAWPKVMQITYTIHAKLWVSRDRLSKTLEQFALIIGYCHSAHANLDLNKTLTELLKLCPLKFRKTGILIGVSTHACIQNTFYTCSDHFVVVFCGTLGIRVT